MTAPRPPFCALWGWVVLLILGLAQPVLAETPWRSSLYPADWKPGFADGEGRFLHDFSYAGYHRGEREIPRREGPIFDVTQAPYQADPTGRHDSTSAIQAALDAAAATGGGVVFLPSGTYRIAPAQDQPAALRVEGSHVVLRGEGTDKTFLFNDETVMPAKTVLLIKPAKGPWWYAEGDWVKESPASRDLPAGSTVLPVKNAALFTVRDRVIVRNDLTEDFIASLGMTGKWTRENMKNRALVFCREIVAVDADGGTVTIDTPTRYELKTSDHARVVKLVGSMISETGLEDFSLGMKQHPGTTWGEEDHQTAGTPAHDVHRSQAIVFSSAENCWLRRVNSFCPPGNSPDVHVLSNGVKFDRSRQITAVECDWRHAQYQGGGGNGYLYTLHGNECLIRDCRAENGRHNYDFGTMAASGNVLFNCVSRDGRLASDFHMHFSVANLLDSMVCDGDFLEAKYRRWGSGAVHGVTTTQSVFWNTLGLRYPKSPFDFNGKTLTRPQVVVESEQFGHGYFIGTRGPAHAVKTSNFLEGEGRGDTLEPPSLYLDQLSRRQAARP